VKRHAVSGRSAAVPTADEVSLVRWDGKRLATADAEQCCRGERSCQELRLALEDFDDPAGDYARNGVRAVALERGREAP
jgi:hypothetical protein